MDCTLRLRHDMNSHKRRCDGDLGSRSCGNERKSSPLARAGAASRQQAPSAVDASGRA
jgi:hypothetical protein